MQKLTISYNKIPDGFLGFYELNKEKFYCYWPEEVYHTGITYTCKKYFSPGRKENCYHITNDKDTAFNLRFFEIHEGNYRKDTHDCILVGTEFYFREQGFMVLHSRTALNLLFSFGDSFQLEFVKLT